MTMDEPTATAIEFAPPDPDAPGGPWALRASAPPAGERRLAPGAGDHPEPRRIGIRRLPREHPGGRRRARDRLRRTDRHRPVVPPRRHRVSSLWATYSVLDHVRPRSFVADV